MSNHNGPLGSVSLPSQQDQDISTLALQQEFDLFSIGLRSEQLSGNNTRSAVPIDPENSPDPVENETILALLDGVESFNNVLNQITNPSHPAGTHSSQLRVWRLLSGSPQAQSGPPSFIRDISCDCVISDPVVQHTHNCQLGGDLPQTFLTHFFAWCMHFTQGSSDNAEPLLHHAGSLLQHMISTRHPDCLIVLNVLLSVVEAHGQRDLASDFLSSVLASIQLGHCPVEASANFMVGIASRKLAIIDVDHRRLQTIHKNLEFHCGPESPSALVGLYHLAWRYAKDEEHQESALEILERLLPTAEYVLGQSHFFTITCMATMARVLSYIRSLPEALLVMDTALQAVDSEYAPFHPYRLELLYRRAVLFIEAECPTQAEKTLCEVITYRVQVLGIDNVLTRRSLGLLQEALAMNGQHIHLEDLRSGFLSSPTVNQVYKISPLKAYLPAVTPAPTDQARA
ncbi:hypothetical protein HC762_01125 [bacterium]|nr:hypothetical protein [bacterium]